MSEFNKKWTRERKQPIEEKIRDSIFPPGQLRTRIEETQRALQSQISKLDAKMNKIQQKDAVLFKQAVDSMQKHDNEHASTYSSELAEVRKMMRTVTQTKMVLEQINLRMSTVQEIGDLAVALSPAVTVVRGIRSDISGILPQAGSELGEIGEMLGSIVSDAGKLGGLSMSFEPASEDAEKILAEATAVAEKKMSDRLPDLQIPTAESIE